MSVAAHATGGTCKTIIFCYYGTLREMLTGNYDSGLTLEPFAMYEQLLLRLMTFLVAHGLDQLTRKPLSGEKAGRKLDQCCH